MTDPTRVASLDATDIRRLIADDSARNPRTLKAGPGPSSIGHPCPRHLAHLIANTPKISQGGDPLPAWVGTEGHAGMERILSGLPDWETEIPVTLGGYGITGTTDAYHRPTKSVYDWKFVGVGPLRKYRADGPGQQYRWQAHLYGCGLSLAGYDVETVAICFIPRSGMSTDIHIWSEPYDPQIVETAMARYDAITTITRQLGPASVPTGPAKDLNCDWCSWYLPAATDLTEACPGVDHA